VSLKVCWCRLLKKLSLEAIRGFVEASERLRFESESREQGLRLGRAGVAPAGVPAAWQGRARTSTGSGWRDEGDFDSMIETKNKPKPKEPPQKDPHQASGSSFDWKRLFCDGLGHGLQHDDDRLRNTGTFSVN
jgi:hypothetical protein